MGFIDFDTSASTCDARVASSDDGFVFGAPVSSLSEASQFVVETGSKSRLRAFLGRVVFEVAAGVLAGAILSLFQ